MSTKYTHSLIIAPVIDADLLALVQLAVKEDMGQLTGGGDKTVELSIPATHRSTGAIVTRKAGVCAGGFLLPTILKQYDPELTCEILTPDGSRVTPNQVIAKVSGPTRGLLSAERVLLNFLGHQCGIASITRTYVDAVADLPNQQPSPAICDTRKTTPGFRRLDKYAVACGGGLNHRIGLYDGVMLKDNHLAALRIQLGQGLSLLQLTTHIRQQIPPTILLWLEVDTLAQLADALPPNPQYQGAPAADVILLDNFTPDQMRAAIALRQERTGLPAHAPNSKPQFEASGGITLSNLREAALTGVERISIGALTHSAPVLDVGLDLEDSL